MNMAWRSWADFVRLCILEESRSKNVREFDVYHNELAGLRKSAAKILYYVGVKNVKGRLRQRWYEWKAWCNAEIQEGERKESAMQMVVRFCRGQEDNERREAFASWIALVQNAKRREEVALRVLGRLGKRKEGEAFRQWRQVFLGERRAEEVMRHVLGHLGRRAEEDAWKRWKKVMLGEKR